MFLARVVRVRSVVARIARIAIVVAGVAEELAMEDHVGVWGGGFFRYFLG